MGLIARAWTFDRLKIVHADAQFAHLLSSIRCCKVAILNEKLLNELTTDNSTALPALYHLSNKRQKEFFTAHLL